MTRQARALSKPKGAGVVALNWLENDGDGADSPSSSALARFGSSWGAQKKGVFHYLSGKRRALPSGLSGQSDVVLSFMA